MHQRNFLAEDILAAYDALGGIEYLKKHPALLERILLKIVADKTPPPELVIDLRVEMPWLDFSQRLAYKEPSASRNAHSASGDVQDAVLVAPSSPPAVGWRDGDPDIGARAFRAEQDLKKP